MANAQATRDSCAGAACAGPEARNAGQPRARTLACDNAQAPKDDGDLAGGQLVVSQLATVSGGVSDCRNWRWRLLQAGVGTTGDYHSNQVLVDLAALDLRTYWMEYLAASVRDDTRTAFPGESASACDGARSYSDGRGLLSAKR